MRNLAYQIKQIYGHTKSGSYSSQASRRRKCSIIARDIEACGYRNLDIQNLKPKHIEALVAAWKERELAIGTIKNLMTELRRIAEYIGKENIVKRTNREYGIDDRVYVTNVSKANKVTDKQLARPKKVRAKLAKVRPPPVSRLENGLRLEFVQKR